MTNKLFKFAIFSLFAIILLASSASAAITLSTTTPAKLSHSSGSFTIGVNSSVAEQISISASTITDYNGKSITFTTTSNSTPVVASTLNTFTMNYVVESGFDFFGKTYTSTLTATGATAGSQTQTLTFEDSPFCEWDGNNIDAGDELKISIRDISVIEGFGEDDEWFPLDQVEIEVRVENKAEDDIENIVLEWGVFDEKTGEWIIEVVDEDEFDVKDGEKETKIISFTIDEDLDVDLSDLESSKPVFFARVTGEVDNSTSPTLCGSAQTASNEASIVIENDFVIVGEINALELVSCGSELELTANVWNIGSDDQDDVYVYVYNKELGIDEETLVGDIDAFDYEKLSVLLPIPENAKEKMYALLFSVYDEDNDIYETGDDEESEVEYFITVKGACSSGVVQATVSADLGSEQAVAGEELVVKATLVNTMNSKATFLLALDKYQEWASLADIDKTSFTLEAGASQEVLITLLVNEGITGNKQFDIIAKEGDKTLTQPVMVLIEEKPTLLPFTGLLSSLKQGNNWLWLVVGLNLILIGAIVIVVIRIFKKKKN